MADRITGGIFLALGIGLLASGAAFPSGVAGLPGAGFFPQAIGAAIAALAAALLLRRTSVGPDGAAVLENPFQVGGISGLLFAYLLLWGSGWFLVRTAIFLVLALRVLRQPWGPALAYAAALTASVYLAFDVGLNVSLE